MAELSVYHWPEDDHFRKDYLTALEVIAEAGSEVYQSHADSIARVALDFLQGKGPSVRWGVERYDQPGTLGLQDLVPGLRVTVRDSQPEDGKNTISHNVILSEPYWVQHPTGEPILFIEARSVTNHETDQLATTSKEGVELASLCSWGLAKSFDGLYRRTRYVEPYSAPNGE